MTPKIYVCVSYVLLISEFIAVKQILILLLLQFVLFLLACLFLFCIRIFLLLCCLWLWRCSLWEVDSFCYGEERICRFCSHGDHFLLSLKRLRVLQSQGAQVMLRYVVLKVELVPALPVLPSPAPRHSPNVAIVAVVHVHEARHLLVVRHHASYYGSEATAQTPCAAT